MRKLIAVLLILCLLCISGCTNDQQAIYDEFADKPSSAISSAVSSEAAESTAGKTGADGLTGELRIGRKYEWKSKYGTLIGIYLAAAEFEAMHPGVKIVFEAGISDEEYNVTDEALYQATEARYTQNRTVELMSGEAPDIVDMDGLSMEKIAASGLLYDLYSFGDFNEAFPEDKYFTNMLKGAETEEGLFALPIDGNPSFLWVNREVAELLDVDLKSMESINIQDILDMYHKAADQGLVADSFVVNEQMSPDNILQWEFPSLIDERAGKADFNTDSFCSLLEDIKGARFGHSVSEGTSFHSDNGPPPEMDATTQLCFHGTLDQTDMVNYATGLLKAEPVPRSTTDGRRLFGGEVYAITQNCKNKELAWEFLKFAVSFFNIDENGKAICTAGNWTEGETVDKKEYYELKGGPFLKRDAAQEAWKLMMGKTYTDEIGARMLEICEGADTLTDRDPRLYDAMQPLYLDYFDRDLLTAEQCAQQLQEKADIYLQE